MKISDSRLTPTFELESAELALGGGPIVGIDEAGRGPWAGPVVAAAVILDPADIPRGIADSKALDEDARAIVERRIRDKALAIGLAVAERDRIDRDNILNATLWAMAEAVKQLTVKPQLALVDGNKLPLLACPARAIVKGDAKCLSIAAASIIAKVARDRIMYRLAREYPDYGFDRHKGYGTPEHKEAIARHGITPHHRRSFKPVQLALGIA